MLTDLRCISPTLHHQAPRSNLVHVPPQLVHIYKSTIFWWALFYMNQQISCNLTHSKVRHQWQKSAGWKRGIPWFDPKKYHNQFSYLHPSCFSHRLCSFSARPWTWRDSRNPFTIKLWKHERFFTWSSRFVHSWFGKFRRSYSLELHSTLETILQRDLRNTYFDYMLLNIPGALIFIKVNRFTLSLMEVTLLVSEENINYIIAQL